MQIILQSCRMASCAVTKWSCAHMNFGKLEMNFSNASQVASVLNQLVTLRWALQIAHFEFFKCAYKISKVRPHIPTNAFWRTQMNITQPITVKPRFTPLFMYFQFRYCFLERITLNTYSNLIYILHLTYSNLIYVLSKVRILNTGVCTSKYKGPIELHGNFGESVQQDWNCP
jgi:hypothetical protein